MKEARIEGLIAEYPIHDLGLILRLGQVEHVPAEVARTSVDLAAARHLGAVGVRYVQRAHVFRAPAPKAPALVRLPRARKPRPPVPAPVPVAMQPTAPTLAPAPTPTLAPAPTLAEVQAEPGSELDWGDSAPAKIRRTRKLKEEE